MIDLSLKDAFGLELGIDMYTTQLKKYDQWNNTNQG